MKWPWWKTNGTCAWTSARTCPRLLQALADEIPLALLDHHEALLPGLLDGLALPVGHVVVAAVLDRQSAGVAPRGELLKDAEAELVPGVVAHRGVEAGAVVRDERPQRRRQGAPEATKNLVALAGERADEDGKPEACCER